MFKTTAVRCIPLTRVHARSLVVGASPCRTFTTSHPRPTALTSKPLHDDALKAKGSIRGGKSNTLMRSLLSEKRLGESTKTPQAQLTKADGVSTVPTMVRGDWVLFHPVYTEEELRAVEVSRWSNS